jgi:hypothetical protein
VQIQVSSNHGPRGSGGATIGKIILYWKKIEDFLFQNKKDKISIKLCTNHSWVKRVLVCSEKGSGQKITKAWLGHLKILFLENDWVRKTQI